MYGRKDLVKITTLTNLSAILRTIKKCLEYAPGSTPTFLYFDLFLNTTYAVHYVYFAIMILLVSYSDQLVVLYFGIPVHLVSFLIQYPF